MKFIKVVLISILTFCTIAFGYAQTDTLIFNTGELIVGEIKGSDKNVITIETAYSSGDIFRSILPYYSEYGPEVKWLYKL